MGICFSTIPAGLHTVAEEGGKVFDSLETGPQKKKLLERRVGIKTRHFH